MSSALQLKSVFALATLAVICGLFDGLRADANIPIDLWDRLKGKNLTDTLSYILKQNLTDVLDLEIEFVENEGNNQINETKNVVGNIRRPEDYLQLQALNNLSSVLSEVIGRLESVKLLDPPLVVRAKRQNKEENEETSTPQTTSSTLNSELNNTVTPDFEFDSETESSIDPETESSTEPETNLPTESNNSESSTPNPTRKTELASLFERTQNFYRLSNTLFDVYIQTFQNESVVSESDQKKVDLLSQKLIEFSFKKRLDNVKTHFPDDIWNSFKEVLKGLWDKVVNSAQELKSTKALQTNNHNKIGNVNDQQ